MSNKTLSLVVLEKLRFIMLTIFLLNILGFLKSDINLFIIIFDTIIFLFFSLFFFKYNSFFVVNNQEQKIEIPAIVTEEQVEEICDPLLKNRPATCHTCTYHIYFIQECIPIIKKLINNSLESEEIIIQDLFKSFEEISDKTDEIVRESESSMNSIFDKNQKNNLTYVKNTSNEITEDLFDFLKRINEMNQATDVFVNSIINSFNSITNMTKDIIDLAEQVQVISINVRIEAARIKDSGGFKVLGKDISDFSDKTSKIAGLTNEKIKTAINNINIQKEELISHIGNVEETAKKVYSKINPFDEILSTTSNSIMSIIKNFNNVSTNLQQKLRSSIVNLQYQDITSQEINHIIKFLDKIGNSGLMDRNYSLYMSTEEKKGIKIDIVDFLKKISTTINEENEIKRISKQWNIKIKQEEKVESEEINNGVFIF